MPRLLSVWLSAVLLALAFSGTAAAAVEAPLVGVLVIEGKGFGHGVGMAQDGMYWMAKNGATTPKVLAAFYPGTKLGKAGGSVRVLVHTAPVPATETALAFPGGGRITAGSGDEGFPVSVPAGGEVRVGHDGSRYWVDAPRGSGASRPERSGTSTSSTSSTETTSTLPITTSTPSSAPPSPPPSDERSREAPASTDSSTSTTREPAAGAERVFTPNPLSVSPSGGATISLTARNRTYRGRIEVRADEKGLRVVNILDVESYLKGMGEVRDSRWPAAALRAQAIAARTYAMRAMAVGGDICDDQRCQVYLGAQAEYGAMNKAVADTSGQVVTHKGRLASTVYSANGGGHSASREEGFGTSGDGYPYLRPAPYSTKDPLPWKVRVGLRDVGSRLGYAGELSGVTVARRGPSGRALEVELDGTAGRIRVSGRAFDARLGLKSTLFDVRVELAFSTPPPPPIGGAGYQALPEDAVALPPRPPDPEIPVHLRAQPTLPAAPGRAELLAAPPHPKAGGSSNLPVAIFVVLALALAGGTSHFGRRATG